MTDSSSASTAPVWQAALDSRLTRRLLRPLQRPGMIGTRLARSAVARLQRMAGGFPLLPKLSQRWSSPEVSAVGQVPIVYAQPVLPSAETAAATASTASSTHSSPRPIVQAKAAPTSLTSSATSITSAKPWLSSNNPAATSSVSSPSLGDQSRKALVTNSVPVELTSVRPIKTETAHLQPAPLSPPPPPRAATLHSPPSLPVVRPGPVSGNVVQRKSIANVSPSAPAVISKQTDNAVQRKAASEPSPKLTAASASAESPAPLPVARPRTTSVPETPLGRELFREPTLNLASPAPVQRVVVRPLPTLSTESNLVQRALHQPSAATVEVGRANAGAATPASALPFSAQANRAAPEFINTTSGNQARPMPMISHTSSPTPVIQRQAAPVEQKTPTPVIQRAPRRGGGSTSDIDELAEKVQAKLAHWLTIESERRGLTRWD